MSDLVVIIAGLVSDSAVSFVSSYSEYSHSFVQLYSRESYSQLCVALRGELFNKTREKVNMSTPFILYIFLFCDCFPLLTSRFGIPIQLYFLLLLSIFAREPSRLANTICDSTNRTRNLCPHHKPTNDPRRFSYSLSVVNRGLSFRFNLQLK